MSELTITILIAQSAVILALAGWLFYHERSCAERWGDHLKDYGELKGRVVQWHEDHARNAR